MNVLVFNGNEFNFFLQIKSNLYFAFKSVELNILCKFYSNSNNTDNMNLATNYELKITTIYHIHTMTFTYSFYKYSFFLFHMIIINPLVYNMCVRFSKPFMDSHGNIHLFQYLSTLILAHNLQVLMRTSNEQKVEPIHFACCIFTFLWL